MMGKRKTEADYRRLAESRGFEFVGPEVPNVNTKTWWLCESGHKWAAPFNRIQQKHGCPYCAGKAPKTEGDYLALAQKRGFSWQGPMVNRVTIKTRWLCSKEHSFMACYHSVRKGSGCPICAGNKPKTIGDYRKLAKSRNFIWCGPMVPNIGTPTIWECEKMKHRWSASYSNIKFNKSGCPQCARNAPLSPAKYRALAKKRAFHWLGPPVPNTSTNTQWQCGKCGGQWFATYANISQGSGCPTCADENRRLQPDDYFALAKKNNLHWIGGPRCPTNNKIKTLWKCAKSHKFSTAYHTIQQGGGCPQCAEMLNGVRISQPQKRLQQMLGGELNYPCGSYRIDVALPSEKIAIEYDCWFWHGDKQEYDAQRDADLLAAGWKLLHIKTNRYFPSQQEIKKAIARLISGERRIDIILDDWGKGKTFIDVKKVPDDMPPHFQLGLF